MSLRYLIVVALCAACRQAEPPPPGSEILAKTRALAAAMCACKSTACAQPLRLDWDSLTKEFSGVTFSADQVEALATEDQRFMRCMEPLAPPTGSK